MPFSLEDLTNIEQGRILIVGDRRSGKSRLCQQIALAWIAAGHRFRYFGHDQDLPRAIRPHWTTPINDYRRLRGYNRVIIDEVGNLNPRECTNRLVVASTSYPSEDWVISTNYVVDLETQSFTLTRPAPFPKPSPTVWERLLIGVVV